MSDTEPTPPDHPLLAGLVGAAALVVLVLVPLRFLTTVDGGLIRIYFGFGIGGLWVVGGLSLVLAIGFQAARRERTDTTLVASMGLGGGLVLALTAVIWAVSVDPAVVTQITPQRWFRYHRWLIALASVVPALASIWLARRLHLL